MIVPNRSEQEAKSHEVFNALMWALSYPGEKQQTAHATLASIGEALLDLETSFYTSDEPLARTFLLTTAKAKPIAQADYLFFSSLNDETIALFKELKRGNLLYPDHAATLIIACQFAEGSSLELSGPGIETRTTLRNNLPLSFWQMRNQMRNYPLGWDVFLCDGQAIVGIPRTTEVNP